MYNFSWYWSSLSAASPDLLKSCSSCGECLVEFKCPLHSKCWKCFFLVMPICLERLNYLLWNIEHIMIKFRVRFYLQKGNGVFCTYILLMDHFKSQQCLTGFFHTCLSVLNFYFYHSFVQPTKIEVFANSPDPRKFKSSISRANGNWHLKRWHIILTRKNVILN